jgi:hypothetical protein
MIPDRPRELLFAVLTEELRFHTSCIVCWGDCRVVVVLGGKRNANGIGRLCLDLREHAAQVLFRGEIPLAIAIVFSLICRFPILGGLCWLVFPAWPVFLPIIANAVLAMSLMSRAVLLTIVMGASRPLVFRVSAAMGTQWGLICR